MKKAAALMIMVGLLASLYLDYHRMAAEKDYRTVEVMVDYDELKELASGNNLSLEAAAARFKERGATAVLVRERTLYDLKLSGHVQLLTGGEVRIRRSWDRDWLPGLDLPDDHTCILFYDRVVFEDVRRQLELKKGDVAAGSDGGVWYLAAYLTEKEIEKMGVGFLKKDAIALTNGGLAFIPRIRDWPGASRQYFELLLDTLRGLPGVEMVTFNDPAISFSDQLPILAEGLKEMDIPVGTFEFFGQQGLPALAWLLDKNVVRIHSISEEDMARYNEKAAVERFSLAVSERNIRGVYVRFFGISNPGLVLGRSLNYVRAVADGIAKEGFSPGTPNWLASLPYSAPLMFLAGLGVIGGALLLTEHFPIPARWSLILGIAGVVGWAGSLAFSPLLARKAFALFSVLVYPVLAILSFVCWEKRKMGQAVLALLKICALSLVGAVIMTGLLADKSFMLKLNNFSGVKLAHILPLAIIPAFYLLRGRRPLAALKELLNKPVTYLYLGAGVILLAALAIYVMRTGNDAPLLVSSWEVKFREVLDRLLGVRPRTKEFLFGHPALLLLLYFGYDRKGIIKTGLLLLAVIGQVSLVNTYAHIHTPLFISLIRSAHGLWMGVLLGVVLALAADYGLRLFYRRGASE